MTIISWNVNGIRAAEKKGFFKFLETNKPDLLCVQETKARPAQLSSQFIDFPGYHSYWSSAEKAGYSGVAVYSKTEPSTLTHLDAPSFDAEGRGLILEFPTFYLINAYFPNSQEKGKRLDYKLAFCDHIFSLCKNIVNNKKNVVLCGDYNIAHKAIDLARPKANEQSPGYLPEERAWMDSFCAGGFADSFRHFVSEGEHYTWWSYRSNARANNVGWRLDYFCCNQSFLPHIKQSLIMNDITGSDHCPVKIQVEQ